MQTAFILVFFLAVLVFGLCRKFKERKPAENIFYILTFVLSLTVLLLKSQGLLDFTPTTKLTELFNSLNLLPKS